MKKRIKINVTRRDIDAAIEDITFGKNICAVCPVARAFQRHKVFGLNTTCSQADAHNNPRISPAIYWSVDFPESAREFIRSFDNKETRTQAKPFHFYVEVPECLLS